MMPIFMIAYWGLLVALIFWAIKVALPPKYNSLIWQSPKNGGGFEPAKLMPWEGQHQWRYKFRWYDIVTWPCYVWKEMPNDTEIGYELQPYETSSSNTMTPEELADNIDWQCARDYLTVAPAWHEILKWGIGLLTIGILIFANIFAMDLLKGA